MLGLVVLSNVVQAKTYDEGGNASPDQLPASSPDLAQGHCALLSPESYAAEQRHQKGCALEDC